uniref:Uncharacterized protein n=1 Tax=Chromera velia CCMP2878 TaxID=1169474 RepID=A0A0G4HR41_9ALVE|eukprot:Cvel_8033.t1-p1 / transcript=Cvel_8033.t1 / gene=Cvel_8033 / organism=Chromera_velia_CCMP2878 / gene_product=hypothetical protein / transcript_product=hypothetical protein / location=Cvel_scaffold434:30622-37625(+) / protein_length=988 / sequence_SO=supercontig / SO=protein_coding / is_pseudo=false
MYTQVEFLDICEARWLRKRDPHPTELPPPPDPATLPPSISTVASRSFAASKSAFLSGSKGDDGERDRIEACADKLALSMRARKCQTILSNLRSGFFGELSVDESVFLADVLEEYETRRERKIRAKGQLPFRWGIDRKIDPRCDPKWMKAARGDASDEEEDSEQAETDVDSVNVSARSAKPNEKEKEKDFNLTTGQSVSFESGTLRPPNPASVASHSGQMMKAPKSPEDSGKLSERGQTLGVPKREVSISTPPKTPSAEESNDQRSNDAESRPESANALILTGEASREVSASTEKDDKPPSDPVPDSEEQRGGENLPPDETEEAFLDPSVSRLKKSVLFDHPPSRPSSASSNQEEGPKDPLPEETPSAEPPCNEKGNAGGQGSPGPTRLRRSLTWSAGDRASKPTSEAEESQSGKEQQALPVSRKRRASCVTRTGASVQPEPGGPAAPAPFRRMEPELPGGSPATIRQRRKAQRGVTADFSSPAVRKTKKEKVEMEEAILDILETPLDPLGGNEDVKRKIDDLAESRVAAIERKVERLHELKGLPLNAVARQMTLWKILEEDQADEGEDLAVALLNAAFGAEEQNVDVCVLCQLKGRRQRRLGRNLLDAKIRKLHEAAKSDGFLKSIQNLTTRRAQESVTYNFLSNSITDRHAVHAQVHAITTHKLEHLTFRFFELWLMNLAIFYAYVIQWKARHFYDQKIARDEVSKISTFDRFVKSLRTKFSKFSLTQLPEVRPFVPVPPKVEPPPSGGPGLFQRGVTGNVKDPAAAEPPRPPTPPPRPEIPFHDFAKTTPFLLRITRYAERYRRHANASVSRLEYELEKQDEMLRQMKERQEMISNLTERGLVGNLKQMGLPDLDVSMAGLSLGVDLHQGTPGSSPMGGGNQSQREALEKERSLAESLKKRKMDYLKARSMEKVNALRSDAKIAQNRVDAVTRELSEALKVPMASVLKDVEVFFERWRKKVRDKRRIQLELESAKFRIVEQQKKKE